MIFPTYSTPSATIPRGVNRSTPRPSVWTRFTLGLLKAGRYSSWKHGLLQNWRRKEGERRRHKPVLVILIVLNELCEYKYKSTASYAVGYQLGVLGGKYFSLNMSRYTEYNRSHLSTEYNRLSLDTHLSVPCMYDLRLCICAKRLTCRYQGFRPSAVDGSSTILSMRFRM